MDNTPDRTTLQYKRIDGYIRLSSPSLQIFRLLKASSNCAPIWLPLHLSCKNPSTFWKSTVEIFWFSSRCWPCIPCLTMLITSARHLSANAARNRSNSSPAVSYANGGFTLYTNRVALVPFLHCLKNGGTIALTDF